MRKFREELNEAVQKLDDHYAELRQTARERLGTLYDPRIDASHKLQMVLLTVASFNVRQYAW